MTESPITPVPGLLLLSEPFMADPHFKRTVVLLCEHSPVDGTVGFVLNRPLGIKVCDTMVDMDQVTSELYYGGPVAQDTLHYLHRFGDQIEDSMEIMDGIFWGGNFAQVSELLRSGKLDQRGIKFFLGYSGWSNGQLEEEMDANSWITANGRAEYVFGTSDQALWKQVLEDKGGKYKQIIHYPEDPILN